MRRNPLLVLVLASIVHWGCAAKIPLLSGPRRLNLRVAISDQANGDSPIPFDVVFVGDKQLAKAVGALEAGTWYQQKRQILSDHPDQNQISVAEFEWTPGQVVPEIDRLIRGKSAAIYAFAGYSTPGAHRLLLRPNRPLTVQLTATGPRLLAAETRKR